MTTLYRPVLIETAEQAEALPVGTYAKNEATTGSGTWYAPPRVNIGRGMWPGDDLYRSSDMTGWTALVPIESRRQGPTDTVDPDFEHVPSPRAHRYCTRWVET